MVEFIVDKKHVFDELKELLNDKSFFKDEIEEMFQKDLPELLKEYRLCNSDEVIERHFDKIFNLSLNRYKEDLQKYWGKYERDILSALIDITEVQIDKPITCYLRNIHWYPRDLDKLEFSLSPEDSLFNSMSTMIHEITHFYYFKKWNEVFPDCSKEYYEGPHPYWHLSEIMAYVIDNDIRVRGISFTTWIESEYAYQRFNNDGKISIQGYFDKLYNQNIGDFEKFLIKAKNIVDDNPKLFD